jgi:hypothetical protein
VPETFADGNVGTLNTWFFSTTGCRTSEKPVKFNVVSGRIPPGTTLFTQGVASGGITGTPTTEGLFAFTVEVQDQTGARDSESFSIRIDPPRPVVITNQSDALSPGTVGQFYCCGNLFADGGVPGYRWSLRAGQLPPGLRLTASPGRITGTPTTRGPSRIVSGQVTVIDLNTMRVLKHIPVTLTPDCRTGSEFDIFHTLQVPIQTPVSPDGRFVAAAVLSLSTVARPCTGSPDHVAVIDTRTDQIVRFVGIPARAGTANGAHGVNFGIKAGGGWYAYVASQFSNMLSVLDLDPNHDNSATDAALAGRVFLANGQPGGARVTDGVGGQGVKPLPTPYDGWIQDTVAAAAQADPEVRGWIAALTPCQRDPSAPGCGTSGTAFAQLTSAGVADRRSLFCRVE